MKTPVLLWLLTGCASSPVLVDQQMVRFYHDKEAAILHGRKPEQLSDIELLEYSRAVDDAAIWSAMQFKDAR